MAKKNNGVGKVKKNINRAFQRREAQVFALSKFYAAEAISYFQKEQLKSVQGRWWTNRTFQAANRVFANAFKTQGTIGWFIAHAIEYGKYLTLGNDRKHDALTPIIQKFGPKFIKDVQSLYKD